MVSDRNENCTIETSSVENSRQESYTSPHFEQKKKSPFFTWVALMSPFILFFSPLTGLIENIPETALNSNYTNTNLFSIILSYRQIGKLQSGKL